MILILGLIRAAIVLGIGLNLSFLTLAAVRITLKTLANERKRYLSFLRRGIMCTGNDMGECLHETAKTKRNRPFRTFANLLLWLILFTVSNHSVYAFFNDFEIFDPVNFSPLLSFPLLRYPV